MKLRTNLFVMSAAFALLACNTDKINNPLDYVPQKITDVCEEGFAPIPVSRTDISPRVGGLAGLPKGTYELLNSEFFVEVSGETRAITYATHILDQSNPSFTNCTRGVKNDTPLIDVSYDAIHYYAYDNTQQTFTPSRYKIKFGPNVKAVLEPELLSPIVGPAAMPGGYTTINVYQLGADKFEIRAIKGAVIGGKTVGMNILQRFRFVAAP